MLRACDIKVKLERYEDSGDSDLTMCGKKYVAMD